MRTYRLDIAYDGSGFRGYARNAGVRTVQGVLEDALAVATRRSIELTVAGRTDAGVHARHNVVSFTADGDHDPRRLAKSVNRMLGGEVVVRSAAVVDDGFDARFSAVGRAYRYYLDTGPVVHPLDRLRVLHVGRPLDVALMNDAAAHLVGEQDFASLCRKAKGRSTVRRVDEAFWAEEDPYLVLHVAGSSFCHQMVRSVVALSIDVGLGRVAPQEIPALLKARDRSASRGAAPSHGLVLWEVRY